MGEVVLCMPYSRREARSSKRWLTAYCNWCDAKLLMSPEAADVRGKPICADCLPKIEVASVSLPRGTGVFDPDARRFAKEIGVEFRGVEKSEDQKRRERPTRRRGGR